MEKTRALTGAMVRGAIGEEGGQHATKKRSTMEFCEMARRSVSRTGRDSLDFHQPLGKLHAA